MSEDKPDAAPTAKAPDKSKDRDPWSDPCPVCGLLGCRRHA